MSNEEGCLLDGLTIDSQTSTECTASMFSDEAGNSMAIQVNLVRTRWGQRSIKIKVSDPPSIWLGRVRRFRPADVNAFIESNRAQH